MEGNRRAVRAGVTAAAKEIWQVPKKLNKLGEEKTSGDEICPMEVSKHGGFETSPPRRPRKTPQDIIRPEVKALLKGTNRLLVSLTPKERMPSGTDHGG